MINKDCGKCKCQVPGSQQAEQLAHHLWQLQTAIMPIMRPTIIMIVPKPPN